jgi:predicted metal-binding protein
VEYDALFRLAQQIGFSHTAPLNLSALVPLEEVRAMCAADRCQKYGKSWGCPPACGSLEVMSRRLSGYRSGLLVQTTGTLSDSFDLIGIQAAERIHKRAFDTLARQARQLFPTCLPLSSGACTRCRACTYPDRPCRFPQRLYPSIEACGIWVSDLCRRSGLDYNYGENTITYTACILADKPSTEEIMP